MQILLYFLLVVATTPSPGSIVGHINGWTVRDDVGTCSIYSSFEGGRFIRLEYDFARNSVYFSVADPAWRSVEDQRVYQVRVVFNNGSEYPAGPATGFRVEDSAAPLTGLHFHIAGEEFLRDFANAGAVGLFMDETRLGAFSLTGTREAISRLRSCALASYHQNPPDPFAGLRAEPAAGPTRPIGAARAQANISSYFSEYDYPATALRAHAQGIVGVRLTIGADGRVSECEVLASSGSADLDSATCRIIRSRARYTPATDANGHTTSATDVVRVAWTLPVGD